MTMTAIPESATRLARAGRVAVWFDPREITIGWPQRFPGSVTLLCVLGLQLVVSRRPRRRQSDQGGGQDAGAAPMPPMGQEWAEARAAAALARHWGRLGQAPGTPVLVPEGFSDRRLAA